MDEFLLHKFIFLTNFKSIVLYNTGHLGFLKHFCQPHPYFVLEKKFEKRPLHVSADTSFTLQPLKEDSMGWDEEL
jgi:hypothetical protein